MRDKGQISFGVFLIVIGCLFLIGRIFNVSMWSIIWPIGFIGLGVWLLLRQRHIGTDTSVSQRFLGDIKRSGNWQVSDEEFRIFIGDVKLDMMSAQIPTGETRIRIFGFIGDVDITLPKSVGVSVYSNGFLIDAKILGRKEEKFLSSIHQASNNFSSAKRRILVESTFFIGDLTVSQT